MRWRFRLAGSIRNAQSRHGYLTQDRRRVKFGTFVIFLSLAFGMTGFVAKYLIQWAIGIK
jgi:hypothetical protein